MKPETKIQHDFIDKLKEEFNLPYLALNVTGQTGWPDVMVLLPRAQLVFIEFKVPGKAPRPKQAYIHRILRRFGFDVKTFTSAAEAIEYTRTTLKLVDKAPKKSGKNTKAPSC